MHQIDVPLFPFGPHLSSASLAVPALRVATDTLKKLTDECSNLHAPPPHLQHAYSHLTFSPPQAPHVRMADEAVCIGPPEALKSYLDADKMLDAALRTGAQAIHPG